MHRLLIAGSLPFYLAVATAALLILGLSVWPICSGSASQPDAAVQTTSTASALQHETSTYPTDELHAVAKLNPISFGFAPPPVSRQDNRATSTQAPAHTLGQARRHSSLQPQLVPPSNRVEDYEFRPRRRIVDLVDPDDVAPWMALGRELRRLPGVSHDSFKSPSASQATPALPEIPYHTVWTSDENQEQRRPAKPMQRDPESARRAMKIVAQQVDTMIKYGISLAARSAPFSARNEFLSALRTVTEALDASSGATDHGRRLDAGLLALREADEFVSETRLSAADVARIIDRHRTPILKRSANDSITALVARQRYYTYAQQELAAACVNEASASRVLYSLGKLYTSRSMKTGDSLKVNSAKAMVFHRAAMIVDPNNAPAANELGVLLAKYGEWELARETLLHCLKLDRIPEAWHNLAYVHGQLGEHRLSRLAEYEFQLVKQKQQGAPQNDPNQLVRWVDQDSFKRMSGNTPSLSPGVVHPTNQARHAGGAPAPASQRNGFK